MLNIGIHSLKSRLCLVANRAIFCPGRQRSGIKPVWPPPTCDEVGFLCFKCGSVCFNVALRIFARRDHVDVARDPREIKGNKGAEQMSAIQSAEPVSNQKIENNARPQILGHPERRAVDQGKALQSEEGIGGQYEAPDLAKVRVSEPKALEHRCHFSGTIGCWRWGRREVFARWWTNTGALPECRLCFHIGEKRAGHERKNGVQVGFRGLEKIARTVFGLFGF